MRIRKNARLLELMLSSSEYPPEAILQTAPHVCQLNQSPWDVLPFSSSATSSALPPPSNSTSSSYPTQNQLEGGEYILSGNASIGDSIVPIESETSMKVEMAAAAVKEGDAAPNLLMGLNINNDSSAKMMKNKAKAALDNDDNDKELEEVKTCNRTNGKGWHCRKEAKKGLSSCEHHNINNSNDNNHNNNSNSSNRKSEKLSLSLPPQSGKAVRRRGRGPGKKASTSNPYEFYYYSGFGPLWGKRRGGGERKEGNKSEKENVENMKEDSPSSSSQQIEHSNELEEAQAVLFMEDDDDDSGGDDNGRKRARKPVKARSLKSLM